MADFCWDCVADAWGVRPEENDLADPDCPEDHILFAICEGCGPGWFDRDGKRVDVNDKRTDAP